MTRAWVSGVKPSVWKEVRGLVGAMRLTLDRIGWKWPSPFVFTNDLGETIDARNMAPKMVQWHVEQTHSRQIRSKYSGKLLEASQPTCVRNECSHGYRETPSISLEEWQGCTMEEYVAKKEW